MSKNYQIRKKGYKLIVFEDCIDTDFRANLKTYMDAVIDDCDTVIINRGNDTGVVLISLEEYNSLKETEYIMSSPETLEAIRKGDEDIKNGRGIKVDIDDLWK